MLAAVRGALLHADVAHAAYAVLTTAHKFKGREAPCVQLADDFWEVARGEGGPGWGSGRVLGI
jgi:hypothetical protein